MPPYISTSLHPKLLIASEPTIRIWIYLVIRSARSGKITTTAKEIAGEMSRFKATSSRAASIAITELEALGILVVRRIGKAMELEIQSNESAEIAA